MEIPMMHDPTNLDLQLTPPERAWAMLRRLRAHPPGRASKGERKETFNAAMEQAEEFFRSATLAGPAVRPILIFYGLSQTGRAIAAVSNNKVVQNTRYHLKGHGIDAKNIDKADNNGLSTVTVMNGNHSGSFDTLATVLNVASLPNETTIGNLWSLLPESSQVPLESPHQTRFLEVEEAPGAVRRGRYVQSVIRRIPAEIAGVIDDHNKVTPEHSWDDVKDRVARYLDTYPGLKGAVMDMSDESPIIELSDQGLTVQVYWPGIERANPDEPNPGPRTVPVRKTVDDKQFIAEQTILYRGVQCAYPEMGQTGATIHPFLVWWAVLYAMSVIARYQPLTWGRLIDVNSSKDAAAIEQILEHAIRSLPELIHRTIFETTEMDRR